MPFTLASCPRGAGDLKLEEFPESVHIGPCSVLDQWLIKTSAVKKVWPKCLIVPPVQLGGFISLLSVLLLSFFYCVCLILEYRDGSGFGLLCS